MEQKKNTERGFSTLELLLSFVILVTSLVAAVLVIYGNQTLALDTELNNAAVYKAKTILEEARADAIEDIDSPFAYTSFDGFYDQELSLQGSGDCAILLTSTLDWATSTPRPQSVSLSTVVGSVEAFHALGGDCDPTYPGDWDNPHSPASFNITGQSGATDVDAKDDVLYLSTNVTSISKDDLFIFSFDPVAVTLTARGSINLGEGVNKLDVASSTTLGGPYAFLASASTTAQLQIVDVVDLDVPVFVGSAQLTGVNPAGSNPEGISIYFYDHKVYVGTKETDGPEFHVFDVSTPTTLTHLGSLELTADVNDIVVHGDYAYLATSESTGELMIVDVSNPASMQNPSVDGTKYSTDGDQDGTALYYSLGKVYLGLKRDGDAASLDDFYALDVSDPENIAYLGSKDLSMQNNTYVAGVVVRGPFAFLALDDPNTGIQILEIVDPTNIVDHTVCTTLNFSENTKGIDMEGEFIFVSNSSNAELRVIQDQPTVCSS